MTTSSSRRRFINKVMLGTAFASFLPKFGHSAVKNDRFNSILSNDNTTEAFWKLIRTKFPLHENRIYFNTGSLGASPRVVIDTVYDWTLKLERVSEGRHDLVSGVRAKVAKFMDCDPDELALTRNTTEGINIISSSLPLRRGDEIILSRHAHVGGAAPWLALQNKKGVKIKLIDLDLSGKNNLQIIKDNISRRTKAVVLSHVTCTTGLVLPIQEIVAYCRERGIFSCIDGAHPLGMMEISMRQLNPDFYATSGHKWLLGPKGTGFLFINKAIIEQLNPVFTGAYSGKAYDLEHLVYEPSLVAHREEYGTRSTPVAMGIAAAVDLLNAIGIKKIEERGRALSQYLKTELLKIPTAELLTPMEEKYSTAIVSFKIKGFEYSTIQSQLMKRYGIRVRGIHENNLNAIRISCAIYNNFEQLDLLIKGLKTIIEEG